MSTARGFTSGVLAGAFLALLALLAADAIGPALPAAESPAGIDGIRGWVASNLGHSIGPFAVVLTLFALNLLRLERLLAGSPGEREVVKLDQLSDVWIQLFVGIGVIWTAVGMRSALLTALGDRGDALTDSAGSVLERLVDGGILLALTTTIVGGIGGYLMRLTKTLHVGAALHAFYNERAGADTRALIDATRRIEQRLAGEQAA